MITVDPRIACRTETGLLKASLMYARTRFAGTPQFRRAVAECAQRPSQCCAGGLNVILRADAAEAGTATGPICCVWSSAPCQRCDALLQSTAPLLLVNAGCWRVTTSWPWSARSKPLPADPGKRQRLAVATHHPTGPAGHRRYGRAAGQQHQQSPSPVIAASLG